MDHIHFQDHVVVHKVRQSVLVGHNAAHLGGCQKHILRLFLRKEFFHLVLTAQVQLFVGAGDNIGVALALQLTHNGAAHHAAMARYINFCILFHHSDLPSF